MSEDDVLASSSAGWKAVALPEPAKMVSLPSLAELPSAVEIEKNDKNARAEAKAAAAAAKAEAKRAKVESKSPVADAPAAAASVAAAPAVTPIGSRITAKQSGGKGKTIAIVGTLMAAAAGVAIFLVVNNKNQDTSHSAAAVDTAPKKETVMPALAAPPAPKDPAPVEEPAAGSAEQVAAIEPPPPPVEEAKPAKAEKKDKVHKVEIRDDRPATKEPPKTTVKVEEKAPPPKEGDPDFDQLLREAGVNDQKKVDKPKLDKKDLSGGDFKNGMNAVSSKARACYKGTQGTAKFKVSISPSGSVASIKMKGDFAGKPEGACVEAAVKSASFPPWDGAPKSFDYSYLLSD